MSTNSTDHQTDQKGLNKNVTIKIYFTQKELYFAVNGDRDH